MNPVGGYLELAVSDLPVLPDSVWARWSRPAFPLVTHNARSALVWVLRSSRARRVWLPAYVCEEVAGAAQAAGVELAWYPAGSRLEPSAAVLEQAVSGDAVVAVCHFGRPVCASFAQALAARPDLVRIEDRAQAFDPSDSEWADWVLYSPRKLLGVPDGGLAWGRTDSPELEGPRFGSEELSRLVLPGLLRLEDPSMQQGQYAAYRESEDGMPVEPRPATALTRAFLKCLPHPAIAAKRRANAGRLHAALAGKHLWGAEAPTWTPLGYPVLSEDPARLAEHLRKQGVFCARHWRTLPSPASFAEEHELARHELTIPCDQRLATSDIERIISAVAAASS